LTFLGHPGDGKYPPEGSSFVTTAEEKKLILENTAQCCGGTSNRRLCSLSIGSGVGIRKQLQQLPTTLLKGPRSLPSRWFKRQPHAVLMYET